MSAAIYAATRALGRTPVREVHQHIGRYRALQARNYAGRVPRPQPLQPRQRRFSHPVKVMVGIGAPLLCLAVEGIGAGLAFDQVSASTYTVFGNISYSRKFF